VLLHDILLVHGSPPARSGLRRVLYFEFRPVETELRIGPHVPEYVGLKQRVLLAAIEERSRASGRRNERPFECGGELLATSDEQLTTWRYPHEQYWRR
jgi:phytanoyl-CoA hydroxylase